MIIEEIKEHVEYEIYGNIDSNISERRMLWDEGEETCFDNQILPVFMEFAKKRHIFLFIKKGASYPLPFMIEKLGMWNNLEKTIGQKFINPIEKKVKLLRYCTFYGVCEIEHSQLEEAFNLLLGGFLLFSKTAISLADIEECLKISEKTVDVDVVKVINHFCGKGNVVVTRINGFDGMSVSLFSN